MAASGLLWPLWCLLGRYAAGHRQGSALTTRDLRFAQKGHQRRGLGGSGVA